MRVAAVVLGGAHLNKRLDGAIGLYERGLVDLIIYTGVRQGEKAKEYLERNGVERYIIEEEAKSTVESACILKTLLERLTNVVVLVSDVYHVGTLKHPGRAVKVFRKALGSEVKVVPFPVYTTFGFELIKRYLHEAFSYIVHAIPLVVSRDYSEFYEINYKMEKAIKPLFLFSERLLFQKS